MYLFLLTTVLSFLGIYASDIANPILNWAYKTSSFERQLLTQKAELKNEQSKLSMIDEFAKYSRLQRKINSLDQDLAELQSQRPNLVMRIVYMFGVKAIFGIILFAVSVYYRSSPVLYIKKDFDLFPFTNIISYPNECSNCISVPFWIVCCTTVGNLMKSQM